MWLSPDTRTDTDPAAARMRAADRWGTTALRGGLAATSPVRPTPEWTDWAAHHARVDAHPVPYIGEPAPPPEPERAYAALQLARTALGDGGWRQELPQITVYCTARTEAGRWLVDELQLTEAGQS